MHIHVEYNLTASEMKEFEYEDTRRGLRKKQSWMHRQVVMNPWVLRLFLAAGGAALIGLVYKVNPNRTDTAIISILVGVTYIFLNVGQYWYDRHQVKKKLLHFGVARLDLLDDKLVTRLEALEQELAWKSFEHFAETRNLYVLYFNQGQALIIPKRVFASELESHLFRGIAQNGIAQTQGFPVETPQTEYRIPARAQSPQFEIGTDSTPLMELEFKLTYADQREFTRAHKWHGPHQKNERTLFLHLLKKWGLICIAVPFGACMIWMAYTTNSDRTIGLIGAILLGALMTLPGPLIYWSRCNQLKKAYANAPGAKVHVYPDGFVSIKESECAKFGWQYFSHFAESEHLFALYLIDSTAVLIPKRAFASDADMLLFRGVAQSGITKAQGFPVEVTQAPLAGAEKVAN